MRKSQNGWCVALWRALVMALVVTVVVPAWAETIDPNKNYTYLYFENGYPTRMVGRRPQDQAHQAARANPDLVIQTGYYSLRLDCDDLQITGYDALAGSDYLSALNEDVTVFSPADLSLTMTKDGKTYTCTRARIQDKTHQYVRLIESGQFVQRFDHLGLIFSAHDRAVPEVTGRLEVTAWPDQVVFLLDLTGVPGVTQTSLQLTSPSGTLFQSVSASDQTRLILRPHLDETPGPLNASSHIREATVLGTGEALDIRFDPDEHALHIDVPADRVTYPEDMNRVDEYVIEVHNAQDTSSNIPLVFDQVQPRAITGTVMTLCEPEDGRPTGIPVQISKNWHKDKDHPTVHEGPWLRGSTMIPLKAGQTRRLRLRVIYGYWGGAGAVSHSQLCVIGYGGNWKWDESALGAWGESMTYDPTLHLGAAFIDDVRPAFTTSMSGKTHGWTENVGGGDFLIYYDRSNSFRWAKRIKTAYRWTGPNMTEVLYSGITDDEKVRFTYRTRSVRTNDYHRRFHAYEYTFLEDVTSPARLVFHQMAADYYTGPTFTQYYRGDGTGLLSSYICDPGGNTYKGQPIAFSNHWLAIDDEASSDGRTKARRGIVSLKSTLNGKALPLYLHTYGRSWGAPKMCLDMSADSVRRSYVAGDVVTGELAFILPPKTVDDYWGPDQAFKNRLASYGVNAWQAVYDEYRYNTQLSVTAHHGTLLRQYPIEIQVRMAGEDILADFTIDKGGIGHVPVILKGVPLGAVLQAQRYVGGQWIPLESSDRGLGDFYQGYRDAQGTLDCVFNVQRPADDLTEPWRIRIVNGQSGHVAGVEQRNYTSYVEECLNTLIEKGTDRYGEEKSPVLVSILDLETLTCPQMPLPLDEHVRVNRRERRNPAGANLLTDQPLLRAMYEKTQAPQWLDRARLVADYYWQRRHPETNLIVERPNAGTGRFDGSAFVTAITGPHCFALLDAWQRTGVEAFKTYALAYLKAYAEYGFDESTGKFWGALKTDGSIIPGPRLAAGAQYGVYEPRGHLDLWEPYVAGYQFPIYTAQVYIWAYELTREPVFLQTARRFAAWIAKTPPGTVEQAVSWYAAYSQGPGRQGTYAGKYGRSVSFLLHLYALTREKAYLEQAQEMADEAVIKLFANGIFRGHPAKPYYESMDGVGYLLNALLDLDKMLENPKGKPQLINW